MARELINCCLAGWREIDDEKKMASYIGLGTAQFAPDYGVSSGKNPLTDEDVGNMLAICKKRGITTIDTAEVYGNAELRLGCHDLSNFELISKICLTGQLEDYGLLESSLIGSITRLSVEKLDAVLVHNAENVSLNVLSKSLEILDSMVNQGLCNRIGVSLYNPLNITGIYGVGRVDVMQAPFNVFDRRLDDAGLLYWCRENGIDVHVRSVFLQGLLLMRDEQRPDYFDSWSILFNKWIEWYESHKMCAMSGAFAAIAHGIDKGVSRLIVGAENPAQLEEIIDLSRTPAITAPPSLRCDDLRLIEPYRWSLH